MQKRRIFATAVLSLALCGSMAGGTLAGEWLQDGGEWRYRNDNGSYAAGEWQWIDGNQDGIAECYYFDDAGICSRNTRIGSYQVNENGAWVENGQVQTQTQAAIPETLHSDYANILWELLSQNSMAVYNEYSIYDLNQDGIPELIARAGTCEADYEWHIYSHNGSGAYLIGTLPAGHSSLYSGTDGRLYNVSAHMGYMVITRFAWNGNHSEAWYEEILETELSYENASADYDAMIAALGLTPQDYRYLNDDRLIP